MIRKAKISYSKQEIKDLITSWAGITIIFTLASPAKQNLLETIIISGITIGLGFIGHELAHKILAHKYGAEAEYKANNKMLLLALIISLTGIIFIAPGAVMIRGRITKKSYGIISAGGPIMNIILSIIFLGLSKLWNPLTYGATINAWLAAFNMIPALGLDGQKILRWNKKYYATILGTAIIILIISL